MIEKERLKLLKEISEVPGISGYEKEATRVFKKHVENVVDEISYDNLGSIIATKKGDDSVKCLFTAHIDEIGFLVTEILKSGFLKVQPVGGWWGHVLLSQRMTIINNAGKKFTGVVGSKPPHGMTMEERSKVLGVKDIYIDLGVKDKAAVEKLGIRVGDQVVPYSEFEVLNDKNYLLGKAWDDRICVAAIIEMLNNIKDSKLNCEVYGAGTVQEEVGLRGAKTTTYKVKPDIAIALDVTKSYDIPGSSDAREPKLGTGIALSIMDSSVIGHRGLINYVEDLCKKHKIAYTFDLMDAGGTDSGEMHKSYDGIINMTISLPCRYFHSHSSIVHLEDYKNLVKLLTEFVKSMSPKVLEELKESKK